MSNRLQGEKSPYLLQHAENPVQWHPWGAEAFARAEREDKPVFLSVGYSTCHWCHVMAHESFEDPEVAAALNEVFVCVKVDREERPDIDHVYMTACQLMTGGGGWPLTVILAPNKQPFFAATYLPKRARAGRMGLLELAPRIRELWRARREDLLEAARRVTEALEPPAAGEAGSRPEAPGPGLLDLASRVLARQFDPAHGGFGEAPKFPTPHVLSFLLRCHRRTGDAHALEMVEATLSAMRAGGLFDQIGFGFHRYSTDERWLVPHFEKMLYDQALLALAYLEAHELTGREEHATPADLVFRYVERDLLAPEGAFSSAEDADSEGEEGRFYLWTTAEVLGLLPPSDAELAERVWDLRPEGNFREEASGSFTGANILHRRQTPAQLARLLGVEERALEERVEQVRVRLLEARGRRVRPHKDDKILVDWNGLMIAALARGARVLRRPALAGTGARAAGFILERMRTPDGGLWHCYRDGEARVPGLLDDYAFLVWGLLELHEATRDPGHLTAALALHRQSLERFGDGRDGGLFGAAADPDLLVRNKPIVDGATPSGNSVTLTNLVTLARLTGDPEHLERGARLVEAFSPLVARAPAGFTHFLIGVDELLSSRARASSR